MSPITRFSTTDLTNYLTTLIATLLSVAGTAAPVAGWQEPIEEPIWKYTQEQPADTWSSVDFDDTQWLTGPGGFGTRSTPGSRVSTEWDSDDIWLRRSFVLPALPEKPALLVHHDEGAEIYLNGKQIATLAGYSTEYIVLPLGPEMVSALRAGKNLLAVHCHQTQGGQFIDAHVIDAEQVPTLPPPKRPTTPYRSDLITVWGATLDETTAWTEYPRPALRRDQWLNLNGNWDYAITPLEQRALPEHWDGKILVPFCLESKLSGVQRLLAPTEALWYRRMFDTDRLPDERLMINFEAVDNRCQVFVNGEQVGEHVGGNTPFSVDASKAIIGGENELVVRVEDATEGSQLRGKQTLDPGGIWYTQVSGIWQTVWAERLPQNAIVDLKIRTDANTGTISVQPIVSGPDAAHAKIDVFVTDDRLPVVRASGGVEELKMTVARPKLWSPDSPHLYDLFVVLSTEEGQVLDQVRSYAGIRTVGKVRDPAGHWRLTLNGQPIFHWGPLDQGWWPDGLLTPPSDEAMLYDIEMLKAAGFNMIRKHIKVEPRRYYYHCDRLGMMVWQDQVSGGKQPPWTRLDPNPTDAVWSDEDHGQFMREFEAMVDVLESHPSIVVWTPFNEAWGQHRTLEVGKWITQRDPTRLVNIASGGNFWPVGDIVDHHQYPHPGFPFASDRDHDFIMVVGEFGGHGYPVPGHLWRQQRDNWGYGGLPQSLAEYQDRYRESIRLIKELQGQGIAAGVYTQTTDVEGEINGLMTYDRKTIKISPAELKEIHRPLFEPGTSK